MIEAAVSHGINEDEQSNRLNLFAHAMKSIATTLAREARFDTGDFATAKERNCEGFQLTLQRLRIDGQDVWRGQFSKAEQQLAVTASLKYLRLFIGIVLVPPQPRGGNLRRQIA